MAHANVNEIQVHYQVRGSGPPLVLLHGFMGSSADWIHLFDLDDLARRHTLVMPDARGRPVLSTTRQVRYSRTISSAWPGDNVLRTFRVMVT